MKRTVQKTDGKGEVLKGDNITLDNTRVQVGPTEEQPPARDEEELPSETQVKTLRGESGKVEAIEVTCSCGRNIHLNCEYMEDKDAREGN